MEQKKYKNLVFDLGGVILDINRNRCVEQMLKIGFNDIDTYLGLYKQQGMILDVETGRITAGEFYDAVREHTGNRTLKDKEIQDAFTAFITGLPLNRIEALRNYRCAGYKLYVLSNTNPVMFHSVIDKLFREVSGGNIYSVFDGVITSFECRACKPEPEIFRELLERFNLNAEESLFFDDGESNCTAARALGIDSLLVPPGKDFMEIANITA